MGQEAIPVDLFNPGQVFACMGLLEVAEVLIGGVRGKFDWDNEQRPLFVLDSPCPRSAVDSVLDFLRDAELVRLAPKGYKDEDDRATKTTSAGTGSGAVRLSESDTFPSGSPEAMALPLRLEHGGYQVSLSLWSDQSSRTSFKLFAGRQRSDEIARQMLEGIRRLSSKNDSKLGRDPFGYIVPLGGSSFKFDPRKSWTGIDAGYSPDEQSHQVEASPIVEVLAAAGLEHARPTEDKSESRVFRYGVWKRLLPPILARPALSGLSIGMPARVFRFTLDLAGKNKVVTMAEEEKYA